MTSAAAKILEEALALPDDDRRKLVEALNRSLEANVGELSSEWRHEVARRLESVESGEVSPVPWDEAEARIRRVLGT